MNFLGDKGPNYNGGLVCLRTHHFEWPSPVPSVPLMAVVVGAAVAAVESPCMCHCRLASKGGGDQDKHRSDRNTHDNGCSAASSLSHSWSFGNLSEVSFDLEKLANTR